MKKNKSKQKQHEEITANDLKPKLFLNSSICKLILLVTAFVFYGNSIPHGYALDDGLVLSENKFVKEGIDGIGQIFMHDSFYGSIGDAANLTGGRYRPLSLAVFAIEYEFVGNNPVVFHFMNVLLYALTCIVLFNFLLQHVFKKNIYSSLAATFIFLIHPVHTEVVANIKSCDEILSLIFLILTLDLLLTHLNDTKNKIPIALSLVCFFLALLSKENGLMFIAIVPFSIYFLSKQKIKNVLLYTLPFTVVILAYILMRVNLIGFSNSKVTELMDAPYLLASTPQKFATIIFVFLKYLQLSVWPYPLTYDYSYNQIPYKAFTDVSVIVSILIFIVLLFIVFISFKQKQIIGWCILFYLLSLFIVSNLLINIGAPMGERFLFQPTVGFCVAIVWLANKFFNQLKLNTGSHNKVGIVLLVLVSIPSFATTIHRNKDWKDGVTLGVHDVKISMNSARALTFAGVNYIKLSDSVKTVSEKNKMLDTAIFYLNRSASINQKFSSTYMNLGVAYYRQEKIDSAEMTWNKLKVTSSNPEVAKSYLSFIGNYYSNKAMAFGNENKLDSALFFYRKSLPFQTNNAALYHNMGSAFAIQHQNDSCIMYYLKAAEIDSNTALYLYDLGGIAFNMHQYHLAKKSWTRCKQIQPDYPGLQNGLNALDQLIQ